jgi:hypothetical protein
VLLDGLVPLAAERALKLRGAAGSPAPVARSPMRTFVTLALLFVATGCVVVRPQQREHLAQPAMRDPIWPSLRRADQHLFLVREGSEGATSQGGGGCGCN